MTVLSACQKAAIRLVGSSPSTLFSTTNQFETEIRDLANEVGETVAKAHDWRALTALNTMTGDGSTTAFDLPSDYDRLPVKATVYSTSTTFPLTPVPDLDRWLEFQIDNVVGAPGYWIILNGQMQILPALGASETGKFYYISNQWAKSSEGTNQTAFLTDTDTFRLPERLITLGVIWRWRAQKRMEFAEDLRNFEIALQEEAGRDKGARMIAIGRARMPSDASMAYPGVIVP